MSKIKIDEELRHLLPALSLEVLTGLEEKLKAEGCRERFTKGWYPGLDEPVLIDGHNRLGICKRRRIPYSFGSTLKFPNRSAMKLWMLEHQNNRRNLTPEQVSYSRGQEYNLRVEIEALKKAEGQCDPRGERISEEMAKKHGVGEKTIRRDAEFAKAVDKIGETNPKQKEQILNGKADIGKGAVVKQTRPIPTKKERKPKSGRERANFKKFESAFGVAIREVDAIAKANDDRNSFYHKQLHKLLGNVINTADEWKQALLAKAKKEEKK